MKVRIQLTPLLYELFPEANGDQEALVAAMETYYTVNGVKPKVTIEGQEILLQLDVELIKGRERLFREAVDLCEKGKFHDGLQKLQKLVEEDPTNSEYHRMLGQVAAELQEPDTAIDHLIDALRWDPKNTHALTMMGNIWARDKDDMDTAMRYYEAAMEADPKDHIAANNIGAQFLNKNRLDEAETWFQKALDIEPDYANAHHGMAVACDRKGDHASAFFEAIQAMKCDPKREELYKRSALLAYETAQKLYNATDSPSIVLRETQELSGISGKPVRVEKAEDIPTPAKLELAEVYNRDEHLVRYKSDQPAVEHLVMHELYHLRYIAEARAQDQNLLFTSNTLSREMFLIDQAKYRARLIKEGIGEEALKGYMTMLHDGMNRQVFNAPIDLFIEFDLYEDHPDLRPCQFLSLMQMVLEAIKATTHKRIVEISPGDILSKSKIYSLTLAMLFQELYGVDHIAEFKASASEKRQAEKFYEEFKEYRADREPGEEYEMVQHWADDLKLTPYFKLISESTYHNEPPRKAAPAQSLAAQLGSIESDPFDRYSDDPEKEEEMRTFLKGQAAIGLNTAVVMYMVDALQYFKNVPMPKIKEAAFEIAMLGTQGIQPEKEGYKLAHVPGKTFSGHHLLAYYYVSWKLAIPEMLSQLQLPFDAEFEMAEKFYRNHA